MLPLLVRRFVNGDAVVYTELRTVVGEQSAHRIVSIEGHLPKLFRFDTVIRHPQAIYSGADVPVMPMACANRTKRSSQTCFPMKWEKYARLIIISPAPCGKS